MTSNCKNCTYSFDAENGWQDFCSVECAREYFTRFKTGAALIQARDDFEAWLANPKNARTVRLDGERAEKPKFGKMVNSLGWFNHDFRSRTSLWQSKHNRNNLSW